MCQQMTFKASLPISGQDEISPDRIRGLPPSCSEPEQAAPSDMISWWSSAAHPPNRYIGFYCERLARHVLSQRSVRTRIPDVLRNEVRYRRSGLHVLPDSDPHHCPGMVFQDTERLYIRREGSANDHARENAARLRTGND